MKPCGYLAIIKEQLHLPTDPIRKHQAQQSSYCNSKQKC